LTSSKKRSIFITMKSTRTLFIVLFVLIVAAIFIYLYQYNASKNRDIGTASLPTDILIVEPQKVVMKYRGLLGTWSGVWAEKNNDLALATTFVVKNVDSTGKAEVVYAWGNNEKLGITEGYLETEAQIKEKLIEVSLEDPHGLIFLIEEKGLRGFYDNSYLTVSALLLKENESE